MAKLKTFVKYELERRPGLLPVYRVYLLKRDVWDGYEYIREDGPIGFMNTNMNLLGWRRLGKFWAEAKGAKELRKYAKRHRASYGAAVRYTSVEEVVV